MTYDRCWTMIILVIIVSVTCDMDVLPHVKNV